MGINVKALILIGVLVIAFAAAVTYVNYRPVDEPVYSDYRSVTEPTTLVFLTGNEQVVKTSQRSTVLTIQRQDSSGNPVTSGSLTINLASESETGKFFATEDSNQPISELTIPDRESSVSVYYSDPETGTPTLTASSTECSSARTKITVSPSQYIAIAYSYKIAEAVTDKYGDLRTTNSEGVFLVVNMTITNHGYHSAFSTDTTDLRPIANGKQDFAYSTFLSLSNWNWTLLVSDGESYSGTVVFQVPKSLADASFTLGYKTSVNHAYPYVIWSKM